MIDDYIRHRVAADALIAHYDDATTRGYLKEHPDYVLHDLHLIEHMLMRIRHTAEAEQDQWGQLDDDAHADFTDRVAEFAEHTCTCQHCPNAL